MVMLRAEFEAEEEGIKQTLSESQSLDQRLLRDRGLMGRSRKADASSNKKVERAGAARKR
ncbi:hypothetical protein D3C83_189720 [compost metagenome]